MVDIFDTKAKKFLPTPPPLSTGRSFLAAVGVENVGRVLFGGGELSEDEKHPKASKDSDVVDVWDAAAGKWLVPMRLSWPRKKLSATYSSSSGLVYFGGGYTSDSNRNNCADDLRSVQAGANPFRFQQSAPARRQVLFVVLIEAIM